MIDIKPGRTWARVVSDVLSPPVVWLVMALPVARHFTADWGAAFNWWAIFALLICLLPVAYILMMVWAGRIGDVHMARRQERFIPLLLTLASGTLAAWLLTIWDAPPVFPLLALIAIANLGVILLVTLFWQISMHAMGITSAATAACILFGVMAGVLLVPLIVLVGAARLALKRHTPAQIAAGAFVGLTIPLLMVFLVGAYLRA